MADSHEYKNIEIRNIKKLIKALESARGNDTSIISLIMPPCDQISRVTKMLGDEFGTTSNIKSRVDRQSVLGAITSVNGGSSYTIRFLPMVWCFIMGQSSLKMARERRWQLILSLSSL
ncbi:hypothetical protein SAY87_000917 [Trapa incisa]|uniref:eRF1/Pelota-like N-terminal domain-containing protein n=1 Tax=Trapa incisa TaxID=236973 RepID=A0AAN7GCR7_9MYRT|nr:hypothetical protein SAY87_000917 [Trapa incisa]